MIDVLKYMIVVFFGVPVTIFLVISLFVILCGPPSCKETWEDSGYDHKWSFWGGCRLKMSDGRWFSENLVEKSDIGNTINIRNKR